MTREAWLKHLEEEGFKRPSRGGNPAVWFELILKHKNMDCKLCKERNRSRNMELARVAREDALKGLGMKKCRVDGKILWE